MRKLVSIAMSLLLASGIAGPAMAAMGNTQTDTPVVAAKSTDFVVDKSDRIYSTSRSEIRKAQTNLVSSRSSSVIFEREGAIKVVPNKKKIKKKPTKPKAQKAVVAKAPVKKVKVVKTVVKKKATATNVKSTGTRSDVLRIAAKYYGVPYVWGGNTPSGFDCSGFTRYVFRQVGVNLPRVSREQYAFSRKITRSQASPGDLVFYKTNGRVTHVAIYAGNGYMIDAPHRGAVVSKRKVYYSKTPYFGRVLP